MLEWHVGDERPYWQPTVTVNGTADDLTTGYTFTVDLASSATSTPVLSKSTGITGGPDGAITVAWALDDLDLDPGLYVAQLTATRTADSKEWTITEPVRLRPRLT